MDRKAQPPGVLLRQGEGPRVHLGGVDLGLGEVPLQGQGDGPRPRPHVQDAGPWGKGKAQGQLHQPLGLRSRDQDPLGHLQGEAKKLHLPQKVLQGIAGKPPF